MSNPTPNFTIPEDCGVEKQVEQREFEAIYEEEDGSLQLDSEAEVLFVPLALGEYHNIALNRLKRANFRVHPMRYGYKNMVAYALQVAK